MKKILLTALLLYATVYSHGQSAIETVKAKQKMDQVLEVHKALYKALPEKAEALLETILRPEFVFTSANGDLQGRAVFLRSFALNPAVKLPLLVTSEQKVIIVGNTAVLTGLLHIKIIRDVNKDNVERELWERITETYVKQGQQWKLLSLQATYTKKE